MRDEAISKRSIFITGTDTGVGKTMVTGLLGRFFVQKGVDVVTQKWVQTGCDGVSEDIDEHQRIMGKIPVRNARIAPYILKFPASPHLAAALEDKAIDAEKIKDSFRALEGNFEVVLAEGAGGLMVPVNDKIMIIDVALDLELPVLVVAENRLGAINRTLLTIEALQKRKMSILGIIFNRLSTGGDETILKDNPNIVAKISGENVLGELPYSDELNLLYESFVPMAKKIFDFM